ncbi:hypothetical protein TNIN_212281 [Trichonephila inaurata madagascariensis]|uniref:Uncharacterized protein n=1 Tax=Trichonephila inaurata madagascariensis TaxID=2747483 RepID=A0A8X6X4V7_9ARAC|nr:hypothetical protein TNIN_212281 [Trichonephila inaurata madagascariensis]
MFLRSVNKHGGSHALAIGLSDTNGLCSNFFVILRDPLGEKRRTRVSFPKQASFDNVEKNREDDQNKRFLFSKTKPETPYPTQWTDPLHLRMRHLQSKQPRTPENPVYVEEHHQFACEARCRWSCCELALRFVDYAIYRRYLAQHPRPTLHGLPVPTSSLVSDKNGRKGAE